jgi:hypothetical protein
VIEYLAPVIAFERLSIAIFDPHMSRCDFV